jgi:beta-glucosidase
VRYEEGVFIGFRHHDRVGTPPLFPFGHGLSYTSFALSDLAVEEYGKGVSVSVIMANTGGREGSEIVQVHVAPAPALVPRPERELKGFAKVRLAPGEGRRVRLEVPERAFAWFSEERHARAVEAGTYGGEVGRSATDLPLRSAWVVPAERNWGS